MNKIVKNKITATIALLLICAMTLTLLALPSALAWNSTTTAAVNAGMKWDFPNAANYDASSTRLLIWNRYHDRVPTRTYNVIAPNPVGVGQLFTVVFYQPIVPPDALISNDIRYQYYNIVTKPDGQTERIPASGTTTSDPTGTNYFGYTPDQIGNYSVTTVFVEQKYLWYASSTQRNFYGITLLQSEYTTTVTVQADPVSPIGWKPTPLPTEYWTRPIEGQNTDWYKVSSNWYSTEHDESNGGPNNRFQPDGTAPNSGHILWTRPTEDQGVIGGEDLFSVPGEVFNAGHQYQPRFQSQIILNGRLYYSPNLLWSGSSEILTALDLRTGELLYEVNTTGVGQPAFGYYYDFDTPNQHGVTAPGWLFTNNFARSYHPARGFVTGLNITNVPSGYEVVGPKGEILRYVLSNTGTAALLAQWNSSRVLVNNPDGGSGGSSDEIVSGNRPANVPITPARPATNLYWNNSAWVTSAQLQSTRYSQVYATSYDWNISITQNGAPVRFANSPTVRSVIENDIMLVSNGSVPQGTGSPSFAYPENSTWWGISLKPGSIGQVIWSNTIKMVDEAHNDMLSFQRAAEGVFVFVTMPTLKWVGFSMYTGEKLWETEELANINPFGYFSFPSLMYDEASEIAYGKLFVGGYIGHVIAFDLYNGTKLWTYAAPTDMSVFKYFTLMLGGVADGKIYVGTHEHSADTPLFKGNRLRVLDVNTGKEVFTMISWPHPRTMAFADGILIYWNNYDGQVYALGKGPSKTTVDAPLTSVTQGTNVVIRGSVIDISAGTNQKEQAARFPNGVPAVSDASQSQWMEYVYMQKERPMNATGVDVIISVLDPNGNFYDIGTAKSDSSGSYSLAWETPVAGKYTVYARYAGSESYWPSYAETAFDVSELPPAASAQPTPASASAADLYFAPAIAGIIVAIVIVGALQALLLLRRRP
jgi:hypothetical protein